MRQRRGFPRWTARLRRRSRYRPRASPDWAVSRSGRPPRRPLAIRYPDPPAAADRRTARARSRQALRHQAPRRMRPAPPRSTGWARHRPAAAGSVRAGPDRSGGPRPAPGPAAPSLRGGRGPAAHPRAFTTPPSRSNAPPSASASAAGGAASMIGMTQDQRQDGKMGHQPASSATPPGSWISGGRSITASESIGTERSLYITDGRYRPPKLPQS